MKDDDEIHVNVTRVVIVMCLTNFTASFCFTVSRGMAGARSGPDPSSIPLGREALRYAALAMRFPMSRPDFAGLVPPEDLCLEVEQLGLVLAVLGPVSNIPDLSSWHGRSARPKVLYGLKCTDVAVR